MREGPHAGMDLVILDLEWNGAYSRRLKGHINEIIEFGAVKLSGEDLSVAGTFRAFVRPQVGKKLSDIISSLTNITDADLEEGISYTQAVSRFRKWMGGAVLLTWGTSDILTLIENCRYFCGNQRIPFLDKYIDLQSYCQQMLNAEPGRQLGLTTAAELLGISGDDFDHHRALGDSLLSLRCLQRVYDPLRLSAMEQTADDEFYRRMTFKTMILCDLNSPLIRPGDMVFHCADCGRPAQRVGDWQLKNKSYRAIFTCRSCHSSFYGRVQFKLKYEGLMVKKSIIPIRPESAAPPQQQPSQPQEQE